MPSLRSLLASPSRTIAPSRLAPRALLAAMSLGPGACLLDLSGLSEPRDTAGSGTSGDTGGAGGGGGTGGSGATGGAGLSAGSGGSGASGGTGGSTTSGSGTTSSPEPSCSPLSCGACEEPCPAPGCPPAVIAAGADVASTPMGLALASGALYWVNEGAGTIARLLDDGSPPQVIATGADQPRTIAAGPDLVVWSAKDGVWACPPESCDAEKKKLAPAMASNSVRQVAYDGVTVFWTDRGTSQDAMNGKVMRCKPASCTPVEIASALWAPTGLTLLDDSVIWTAQAGQYEDGRILKAPKAMDGSTEISAGLLRPTGIAADDLRVYWTEYNSNGGVFRCPHTTGYCDAPANVAAALGPLPFPRDVGLGGSRVYFTTEEDGTIRSCPVPGCGAAETPAVHAAGRPGLHRMIVGPTCLFFTDESNGGSVVKVAR